MLRKGVYPYEYMDSWERFNEASLPDKKTFFGYLNIKGIIDVFYRHEQKVFKELELEIYVSIMTSMFKVICYCLKMYLKF